MYAYKEILTINDPSILKLARPLPLVKGQQVEVLIIATGKDQELENVHDAIAARGISESDVVEAVSWARASS
ncbi:MAG: hypothetical protein A2V79_03705 [Betaproteobacteria bacterium RBG_16_56_24]|nr:MAG: hypothetical protein A2V79_03705 [Betaproteobacteria bacterium RBG_16_56_24]